MIAQISAVKIDAESGNLMDNSVSDGKIVVTLSHRVLYPVYRPLAFCSNIVPSSLISGLQAFCLVQMMRGPDDERSR